MEERIQKLMAQAGIASRRDAEALITQGRVTVNGHVANLGDKADPATDDIRFDGERLRLDEARVYIMINKPMGIVTTVRAQEQEARRTVRELVPVEGYLYPVGRLDADSEGLVLLTNDGELAQKLTHPRYEHPKVYDVTLTGNVSEDVLDVWRRGVVLEDGPTKPVEIDVLARDKDTTRVQITMREGRKRQIRRIANRFGCPVQRLVRVQFDVLRLGNLGKGEWRYLTNGEIGQLQLSAASSYHRGKVGPRPPEKKPARRPSAARAKPAEGGIRTHGAPSGRLPSRRPTRRIEDSQSDFTPEDRPRRHFENERSDSAPDDRPRSRTSAPRRAPSRRPAHRFAADRPDSAPADRSRRRPTGRPARRFDDNPTERSDSAPDDRPRSRTSVPRRAPSRRPTHRFAADRPDSAPADRSRRRPTGRPARRFDDSPTERSDFAPDDRPRSRTGAPRRPAGRPARRSESDRAERAPNDRPRSRPGTPRRRPTAGSGSFQRSRARRPASPRSKPRNRR